MQRNSEFYLKDILKGIENILNIVQNQTKEEFKEDLKGIAAALWYLTTIGEAIGQLPDSIKMQYPDVPWQKVKDFRNVIVHKYHEVDYNELWDVIENKLELLETQIKKIIGPSEEKK